MARRLRQFEAQGSFSTAGSLAINRSRDKLRAYQVLAKLVSASGRRCLRESASRRHYRTRWRHTIDHKVAKGTHATVVLPKLPKPPAVVQAFMLNNFPCKNSSKNQLVYSCPRRRGMRLLASERWRLPCNTHQGGEGQKAKSTKNVKRRSKLPKWGLPICGVDTMRSERGPLAGSHPAPLRHQS